MDKNVYRTILNYNKKKLFKFTNLSQLEIFDLAVTQERLTLTPMVNKKVESKEIICKDIKEITVSVSMSTLAHTGYMMGTGLAFDLVINLDNSKVILQFFSLPSLLKAATKLEEEGFELNDPLSLLTALDTMRYLELEMYLNTNFKKFAKKYPDMENPRLANRYVDYKL